MKKREPTLRDVELSLAAITEQVEAICRKSVANEDVAELTFEQRVINAVRQMDDGHPLRDFLSSDDIEQAINTLADVYTVTGVQMPADWY